MDKTEIVISYKTAEDKRTQLGILAELNLCSKAEIAAILIEAGEKVDKRWYLSGIKKPKPAAAPAQQETPDAAPAQQAAPEGVTLSRAEAAVLREYLEGTLPGWFRVLDVEKILTPDVAAAQLLRVNMLTGIWKKLPGGEA